MIVLYTVAKAAYLQVRLVVSLYGTGARFNVTSTQPAFYEDASPRIVFVDGDKPPTAGVPRQDDIASLYVSAFTVL